MKIGILGAGTLGKFLAGAFCNDRHDVTVIDTSSATLSRIREKSDVMTIVGDGATFGTLLEANAGSWDLFIAAGSDDTVNMHACTIVRHFGVEHVVCRLLNYKYFSPENGFGPEKLGISHVVVPGEECVLKIIDVLDNIPTLEKITFALPDALISGFRVLPGSRLANTRLCEFPEPAFIRTIRFAGVVRHGELFAPRGETELQIGDEVYLAGRRDEVEQMVNWADPRPCRLGRVIVTGRTKLAFTLVESLAEAGFDVRLIEDDADYAEEMLNGLKRRVIVINGDANESDVLEEAGVVGCGAFIAVGDDDEGNILSCILAKRMGAAKVVTLTNKEEYVDLVCRMDEIDCGFSRWLVSGNSVLKYISTVTRTHTNAILHRTKAYVSEFVIRDGARVCHRQIGQCGFPSSVVLSLVFRGEEVIVPYGDLTLLPGDIVTAITNSETENLLGKWFG